VVSSIEGRKGHYMGRAQPPSTDLDTVWLPALIEAMDEVAASSQACEPSDIKAFSNRLNLPVMLIPRRLSLGVLYPVGGR
jgi:hypothetical protein